MTHAHPPFLALLKVHGQEQACHAKECSDGLGKWTPGLRVCLLWGQQLEPRHTNLVPSRPMHTKLQPCFPQHPGKIHLPQNITATSLEIKHSSAYESTSQSDGPF